MSQQQPKAPSRKPALPVGTLVFASGHDGVVAAVRTRKKFARRYFVLYDDGRKAWFRRDELAVPS